MLAKLGDQTHGLRPAPPQTSIEDRDEIFQASYGKLDMSTSTEIATVPKIIWDVNGYYRALDISWPYTPTRAELRAGFLRADGHASERLTYYMTQLLNPEVRQEYDSMPLGSVYEDKYTIAEVLRRLADLASKLSDEESKLVTAQDLIEEHEREIPSLPALPSIKNYYWNWGFYAYKSRKYDTDPLELWQNLLVSAFSDRQVATKISIGYIGRTCNEFDIRRHDDRDVFFLNEETNPTPELAKTAVSKFMAQKQRGSE